MARRIVGLDIGAYSVKLVRLEAGGPAGQTDIQDIIEVKVEPDQSGDLELIERQKLAVRELVRRGCLEGESYSIGLSADAGQVGTMEVPFLDARKIEAVLPGLVDAEVPFELDDMMLAWHRVEKNVVSDEENQSEHIRIAYGKKDNISAQLAMLQSFNIDPRIMHLASAAPFELAREHNLEKILPEADNLCALIDLGHSSTNICIFNSHGLVGVRTFMQGGQILTEQIQESLKLDFLGAEEFKHNDLDISLKTDDSRIKSTQQIARAHFGKIFENLSRLAIQLESTNLGKIKAIGFMGGGANARGFKDFAQAYFSQNGCEIIDLATFLPVKISNPSFALSYAYGLSCLHVHTKENRFNFRKGDFAWRGDLDFLRSKSMPLVLWGLTIICLLVVLWSGISMVLDKEKSLAENRLKSTCEEILGEKNLSARKCLALMKEQVNSNIDLGIPDFTVSDVYLEMARAVKDPKVIITDLDISDTKVRTKALAPSFEDIDKIVDDISARSCFRKVVKGRAEKTEKGVKFDITHDIDCSVAPAA